MNTLIYGSAPFKFQKQTLIRANAPFDLTDYSACPKFVIEGTVPPDTLCRIIFEIEDTLYRFVNGILDPYIWRGELEDILIYGNTVMELLELENVNAFVGKKVQPIIALSAPSNADVFPKIKIALKVSSALDVYSAYRYSPIFELEGSKPRITSIRKISSTDGNATEITECRVRKFTGWDDWRIYTEPINEVATAIQFRTKFVVSTLDGTDIGNVESISVNYTTDADKNAAESQTFCTKIENYDADLSTAYLLIKHSPAENVTFNARACLVPPASSVENVQVGTTNGELQTFNLPKSLTAQDTLHVEIDGVPTFDFEFDTGNATLTLQADAGKIVTVSYNYFHSENWQDMTCDINEIDKKRFTFRTANENLREVAVKFTVTKNNSAVELPEIYSYIAGFAI